MAQQAVQQAGQRAAAQAAQRAANQPPKPPPMAAQARPRMKSAANDRDRAGAPRSVSDLPDPPDRSVQPSLTADNSGRAEGARVPPSRWDTVKLFAGVAAEFAADSAKTWAMRVGVPARMLDFSRASELGWARKAFFAGTIGAPFDPPTDPADKAEWERGEAMAVIVIASAAPAISVR
jgi:hypothetical protein